MLRIKTLLSSAAAAIAAGLLAISLNPVTPSFAADLYPYGQCTYYVKSVRTDVGNHWGNARYWASSARQAGYSVGSQPMVGDIVVFGAYVQGNSPYGHVGIVQAVRGNQFEVISMWGNEATGRIHVNWHHTGGGVSFIHKPGYHSTQVATAKHTTKAKTVSKPIAHPSKPTTVSRTAPHTSKTTAASKAKPATKAAPHAAKTAPVKPAQSSTKTVKSGKP